MNDGLLSFVGPLSIQRDPRHGAIVGSNVGVADILHTLTLDAFGAPASVAWEANGSSLLDFSYTRDKLGASRAWKRRVTH